MQFVLNIQLTWRQCSATVSPFSFGAVEPVSSYRIWGDPCYLADRNQLPWQREDYWLRCSMLARQLPRCWCPALGLLDYLCDSSARPEVASPNQLYRINIRQVELHPNTGLVEPCSPTLAKCRVSTILSEQEDRSVIPSGEWTSCGYPLDPFGRRGQTS